LTLEAGRFRVLGEMLAVIDKLVLDELSRRGGRYVLDPKP